MPTTKAKTAKPRAPKITTAKTKFDQLNDVEKLVDRTLRVVETLGYEVTKAAHQARMRLEAPHGPKGKKPVKAAKPKPKTARKVA